MIIGCWNIIKMGKLVKRAPPWSRVWKWPWQPSHANPTTCRGPAQDQPCDKTMHILILSLNFIRYLVYYCIVRLGNQKSVRGADLETEQCRVSRGRILTPPLLVNKTFLFLSIYMKLKMVVCGFKSISTLDLFPNQFFPLKLYFSKRFPEQEVFWTSISGQLNGGIVTPSLLFNFTPLFLLAKVIFWN